MTHSISRQEGLAARLQSKHKEGGPNPASSLQRTEAVIGSKGRQRPESKDIRLPFVRCARRQFVLSGWPVIRPEPPLDIQPMGSVWIAKAIRPLEGPLCEHYQHSQYDDRARSDFCFQSKELGRRSGEGVIGDHQPSVEDYEDGVQGQDDRDPCCCRASESFELAHAQPSITRKWGSRSDGRQTGSNATLRPSNATADPSLRSG